MRTVLLFLTASALWGQVSFDVQPRVVPENGRVLFKIIVENPEAGRNMNLPNGIIPGPFELANRYPATSSMTQIINGKVSQSQTYTYEFIPKGQGEFVFPSQTIEYLSKVFKSQEYTIKVTEPEQRVRRQNQDPFSNFFGRDRRQQEEPEIFVRSFVPEDSFFVGEAIPYAIKLYRRGVIVDGSRSSADFPTMEGFWSEDHEVNQSITGRERVDGKIYQVTTISQKTLFANQAGQVTIDPASFDLYVKADDFFADFQRVLRQTEPIQLNILPLPAAGKPPGFQGLVGQFKVQASVDKNELKVGESLSLNIDVQGFGNFNLLGDVRPEGLDSSVEVFDGGAPNLQKRDGRVISKSWVYALVPKQEGTLQIPAISIPYFDPEKETYEVAKAGPWEIEVAEGQSLGQGSVVGSPKFRLESEQNLHYISEGELRQLAIPSREPKWLLWTFLGWFFLNLLTVIGVRLWHWFADRGASQRPKLALKSFRKTIKRLSREQEKLDSDAFYSDLSAAIYAYFGQRLQRPSQGISLDLIELELSKRGSDSQLYQDLVELVEGCDFARFTASSATSKEKSLQSSLEVLQRIDEVWS